jgi:hypothetical protein
VSGQGDFTAKPAFISDYTRKGQGITYPMIYGNNGTIPTVNIAGYNGLGASNVNWNNFNRVVNAKNDFSKFMGSHNLKAGILIMRSRKNQDNWPAVNGTASYATGHSNSTGNSMGDALLGNFSQYTEADTNREGWYRFTRIEGYFQDDWKISQRLTLNLGMRYQYMQPQYCALNNCVMFGPSYYNASKAMLVNRSTGALVSGSGHPYNGLVLGGTGFSDG